VFHTYFSTLNSNVLLELLYHPSVFVTEFFYNAILANLGFWFGFTWFEISQACARLRCEVLKLLCFFSEDFFV